MNSVYYYTRSGLLFVACICTLAQSDVVGPYLISADEVPSTLSVNSSTYALSGDVVGNITITGNDVSLNLNEHSVTGRVIISGQRALVYGGKVLAPAPADNATADAGVVQINSAAVNTQIVDVFVAAADGTVAGVRGARGMQIDADNVIIRNSFIAGGNGGPNNGISDGGAGLQGSGNRMIIQQTEIFGGDGSNSTNGTTNTGNGGRGLFITGGDGSQLLSVNVTAGKGGNVAAGGAAIVGPRVFGNGGENRIDGTNVLVQDSRLYAGSSNTVSTTSTMSTGGAFTGGSGGIGLNLVNANASMRVIGSEIRGGGSVAFSVGTAGGAASFTQGSAGSGVNIASTNADVQIESSTIVGGSSGAITTTGDIGIGITGNGAEAVAISSITANVIMNNVEVIGGDGSAITAGGAIDSVGDVTRGTSGNGITSSALQLVVNNSSIVAGNIPLTTATTIGPVNQFFLNRAGDGIFLTNSSGNVRCRQCVVRGGTAGGITTTGNVDLVTVVPISPFEIRGAGGVGLYVASIPSDTKIVQSVFEGCSFYGGQAGTITSGGSIADTFGIFSGPAILAYSDNIVLTQNVHILNSQIATFHGGDLIASLALGSGADAGDGGFGIDLYAINSRVHNCSVIETGRGGNVTAPGAAGSGGSGRTGIVIRGPSEDIELSNNIIASTGVAGTGPLGSGVGGRAILNIGNGSCFIISNYAHTIANAGQYLLGAAGEYVDASAAGTDFLDLVSVPNSSHRLTNVYEP